MKFRKPFISLLLTVFLPSHISAQEEALLLVRDNCMPSLQSAADAHGTAARRALPVVNSEWDASKAYKQLVVLVNFSDTVFMPQHTPQFYDMLFNNFSDDLYEGRKRYGQGSVADYFRDQSGGLFNLSFDIVGPYQVSSAARTTQSRDYKGGATSEALKMMVADQQERDFAPYDWNGDGTIEQVIVIFAGPSGNVSGQTGFLHPNTSSVSSVRTHDGKVISTYSSSAENWTAKGPNCGIGTICHEFTHCLGLPDIYQVSGASNIIVDEWDLMDGGNGTNYGWCPPNFSPLEKNLLGWLSYTELTEPATISDLKPVSEGGTAYQVKHTDSEYYLLENRQQSGWDAGLPGKGLVVWHVNYDAGRWRANTVNNYNELGFQLVHADGKDYLQSSSDVESKGLSHYASGGMMNSRYLSGSAYPFVEAGQANDSLTDQSEPASLMYQVNSSGSEYLGKAITHIQLSPSGLVSFDFMGGSPSAIRTLTTATRCEAPQYYDLSGRRLTAPTPGHLYIVRQCDGTVKVRR